jgi:hypothetical protein
MTGWFATRQVEHGIYLVSEPVHVNSFLIEGEAAAALIDTGLGIGNIRQAAEALTSRDVFALNTSSWRKRCPASRIWTSGSSTS